MTDNHYLKLELYERFREDNTLFNWLEQGSLDGIWYWDLQNQKNEWLSPAFKRLLGYADDEVLHSSCWWQDNMFEEDLSKALENFEKHCTDPSHPYDQVVRYKHKTGKTIWVRCRGLAIFDETGQPIRMIGVHTDVTALKQKESELERSNQELSSFAYVASHDLKAPLRSIKQLAQWIAEDVKDIPDVTNNVNLLTNRVKRMENLLDDLLTYSRAGQLSSESAESIITEQLVHDVFDFINPPSYFQLNIIGRLPNLKTHKASLEQVFRNLIGNAIKHRPRDDGSVSIWGNELADCYEFYVADDGRPIPEKYFDTVFEMFKTLQSRDKIEGSGMGLAICRKVAQLYGGDISLISSDDESLVTSVLPGSDHANTFRFTWAKV